MKQYRNFLCIKIQNYTEKTMDWMPASLGKVASGPTSEAYIREPQSNGPIKNRWVWSDPSFLRFVTFALEQTAFNWEFSISCKLSLT